MIIVRAAITACILLSFILVKAQNSSVGNVEIFQDDRISGLIEKHIAINSKFKKQGYRIQIYFDSGNNSKNGAYTAKSSFLSRYPDVEAYVSFESPFYKVRVGNFRTRLDAFCFLNHIAAHYTNAFIVKGEIDFPPL